MIPFRLRPSTNCCNPVEVYVCLVLSQPSLTIATRIMFPTIVVYSGIWLGLNCADPRILSLRLRRSSLSPGTERRVVALEHIASLPHCSQSKIALERHSTCNIVYRESPELPGTYSKILLWPYSLFTHHRDSRNLTILHDRALLMWKSWEEV